MWFSEKKKKQRDKYLNMFCFLPLFLLQLWFFELKYSLNVSGKKDGFKMLIYLFRKKIKICKICVVVYRKTPLFPEHYIPYEN